MRRGWYAVVVKGMLAVALAMPALAFAGPDEDALRQVLDRHLTAINARDLDALMATVTSGDELTTILPSGRVLETRAQYRQLHVDWFADTSWRMVFEVTDVTELADTGIVRVKYDSQQRDDDGGYRSAREAWLTLVFAREDAGWRLVYDQNTVIPAATP